MAARTLTYVGLLYQDLVQSERISFRESLPAICPVVLYRGDRKWHAPTSLRTARGRLVALPKRFRANVRYQLIDIRRLKLDAPNLKHNLAAAMFRVENSRDAVELNDHIQSLRAMIDASTEASLCRAFAAWLRSVVFARTKGRGRWSTVNFGEAHMLSERIAEWEAGWERAGHRKGHREGKAALLLRLLRARFGTEPPQRVQRKIRSATSAQLDRWGVRLLAAKTLGELFPARR